MMTIRHIRSIGRVMVRYILDTDHISLYLGLQQPTYERVRHEFTNCGISIISVQEVFNGWVGQLGRISNENYQIAAYQKLHAASRFFQKLPILNYETAASQVYQQLIGEHPKLAKRKLENDVRIAAIAISLGATVVTRNRKDFELVPGLAIEDWSQ
jgi:tRNA(fMet)-specific endonuclease VapC